MTRAAEAGPPASPRRPTTGNAYTDGTTAYRPRAERVEHGKRITGERRLKVDACVIGTGAGGAPVAKELAEGGMKVVMLEEGDRFTTDDFTARPREMTARLYRDAGQIATTGNVPIVLPLGSAIGGTTLVNSGTCFRTPAAVLDMWRERFGLESLTAAHLDPFFRRVERVINVAQVPPHLAGRNAAVVKRGADALGWSGDYVWRNVRGCVGSGVCNFGCPTSAKQHVGITYVPRAWDAGAVTYTGTRARCIWTRKGRAEAVEATTKGGGRLHITADVVIVAAGAIHTPLLLEDNGIGLDSNELGSNLAIHPATAVRAIIEEDEPIDMARGVPQSYFVDEFADEGIMLEGAAGPPDYAAMSLPYAGERHRDLMLRYRQMSQFGLMVSDVSRGRVRKRPGGRVEIRYDLCDEDVATFKRGIELLCRLYEAAGATTTFPPVEGAGEMTTARPLADVKPQDLTLMAFHPLGTARADARPQHGVVDADLKIHGTENIYVSDGSVVPSSIGVNPQITIMALATRLGYHLLQKPPPTEEPEPETIAAPRITRPHALTA